MIIAGIDPALNKTGWGIIEYNQQTDNSIFIASGVIKVPLNLELQNKLKYQFDEVTKILSTYKPDEIAMEETFLNKNPTTSLKLGHARGAIMVSCLNHSNKFFEYGANKIKKSVCGMGKADKIQMANMIQILLPKSDCKYDDESDALAVAICHSYHQKISNYKNIFSAE